MDNGKENLKEASEASETSAASVASVALVAFANPLLDMSIIVQDDSLVNFPVEKSLEFPG